MQRSTGVGWAMVAGRPGPRCRVKGARALVGCRAPQVAGGAPLLYQRTQSPLQRCRGAGGAPGRGQTGPALAASLQHAAASTHRGSAPPEAVGGAGGRGPHLKLKGRANRATRRKETAGTRQRAYDARPRVGHSTTTAKTAGGRGAMWARPEQAAARPAATAHAWACSCWMAAQRTHARSDGRSSLVSQPRPDCKFSANDSFGYTLMAVPVPGGQGARFQTGEWETAQGADVRLFDTMGQQADAGSAWEVGQSTGGASSFGGRTGEKACGLLTAPHRQTEQPHVSVRCHEPLELVSPWCWHGEEPWLASLSTHGVPECRRRRRSCVAVGRSSRSS